MHVGDGAGACSSLWLDHGGMGMGGRGTGGDLGDGIYRGCGWGTADGRMQRRVPRAAQGGSGTGGAGMSRGVLWYRGHGCGGSVEVEAEAQFADGGTREHHGCGEGGANTWVGA